MRHRVTVKTIGRVPDGYGGTERSDPDGETVWADVQPATPREQYQYSQLRQTVSHTIRMRYRSDIKQGQTVQCEGDDHYVVGVTNPDRRKRELVLVTRVGGAL